MHVISPTTEGPVCLNAVGREFDHFKGEQTDVHAQCPVLQVLQFYEGMHMRVPNKPPLLLVESSALESAEAREGRCNAGHRRDAAPVRPQPLCCMY